MTPDEARVVAEQITADVQGKAVDYAALLASTIDIDWRPEETAAFDAGVAAGIAGTFVALDQAGMIKPPDPPVHSGFDAAGKTLCCGKTFAELDRRCVIAMDAAPADGVVTCQGGA